MTSDAKFSQDYDDRGLRSLRILFCGHTFPDCPELLRKRLPSNLADEILVIEDEDIRPLLKSVDVVIPKMQRIDHDLIQLGTFGLIQQWGAGVEGIDLEAARARNIWVANVPSSGGNAESVAELTVLLILSLLRDLPLAIRNVRSGLLGAPLGNILAGRTVCLYGLGALALQIARRLQAFDVRLIGLTRDLEASKLKEFRLDRYFSIPQRDMCLAETDVLVLCIRYSGEMRDMIGAHELACLRTGGYLVNVARGGLVNYEALYSALLNGHLAGAALDVFWNEPIPPNDPILDLPNVIATPHIGGVTSASFNTIADAVALNIERFRRGEAPLNQVV